MVNKKLLYLFTSFFSLILVILGAKSALAAVSLTLEPNSGSYNINDNFTVNIILDTDNNDSAGVDLHYLNYPKNLLEVQGAAITAGTLFANTNTNTVDAVNGTIDFSQTSGGGLTYNSQGVPGILATISFKAIAAGAANLSFDFTLGQTDDTNVAGAGAQSGNDILAEVGSASFTLTQVDTTPPNRLNGAPSGALPLGTTQTVISLDTNENAVCKYDTSAGIAYDSMSNTFASTGGTAHSQTITGLSDGQSYSYYVRCQDTASPPNVNTDDFLISFSIAQDTTPPSGATISINNGDSYTASTAVVLTLSATDPESGMGEMQFSNNGTDWSSAEPYAVSKLWTLSSTDGTKTVYVKFSNSLDIWSDPVSDDIILDTTGPEISNVEAGAITDTSAVISWSTSENATAQTAYGLTSDPYSDLSLLDQTLDLTHDITLSNLTPDTVYHYQVISKDSLDNESVSEDYTFTTLAEPDATAPSAITDLTASNPSQTSIDLIWTAPGDDGATGTADTYDIRYSTSTIDDGNWESAVAVTGEPSPEIAGTSQNYTITGLSSGRTYYFAIKTSDEVPNQSPLSNIAQASTSTPPPPGGPSGSGYSGGGDSNPPAKPTEFKAKVSETQVSLSWKNPSDSDFVRVKILRKDDDYPANSTDGELVYDGEEESYIDKGLEKDKTYYYAIFAYDEVPNFSDSSTLKATTTAETPAPPDQEEPNLINQILEQPKVIAIKHSDDNNLIIDLSWENPVQDNIKKINIWRSDILCQRGSLITSIDLTENPMTQYTDEIPEDKTFFYTISSVNGTNQESNKVKQWTSATGSLAGYITKFASQDRDCDGLADGRERLYSTNPDNPDTDGDKFLDGIEIENGWPPNNKATVPLRDQKMAQRLAGKILLAPYFDGESYYVNPDDKKAYYLNRPADAFDIMRAFGLGITDKNLAKIPESGSDQQGDMNLRKRLSGKILLQVEQAGEAWYIYPDNLKRYYLGRPADAFAIMRQLSLGISNENLIKLDLQL